MFSERRIGKGFTACHSSQVICQEAQVCPIEHRFVVLLMGRLGGPAALETPGKTLGVITFCLRRSLAVVHLEMIDQMCRLTSTVRLGDDLEQRARAGSVGERALRLAL
jgi:hypothetical protein